jgi:hypothetical protein
MSILCRIGLHCWQRLFEERLYGDIRLMADYRYVDQCTRCGRKSEILGKDRPTTGADQ